MGNVMVSASASNTMQQSTVTFTADGKDIRISIVGGQYPHNQMAAITVPRAKVMRMLRNITQHQGK